MSEEALQEVWPSFLQDERNKKDSKDEVVKVCRAPFGTVERRLNIAMAKSMFILVRDIR